MAGLPGMAGDRQGQRHRTAEGLDVSDEQKRDGDAVMLCVHGGRREPSKKKKKEKENKKRGKQKRTTPQGGGTEKDEWLGPRDGPRWLGQLGRRHRREGWEREGSNPC